MPHKGKKLTQAEIELRKANMLDLFRKGLNPLNIKRVVMEKYGFSERTFWRYWTTLMQVETEKLKEKREEFVLGYIEREKERMQEAHLNYKSAGDDKMRVKWLYASHNIDKELFEKLQSLGFIPREAQQIDLNVFDEGLAKARELYEKLEREKLR